jgi:hypothetical protein
MSYDDWKLRAPEDEPGYDAGEPAPEGVACIVCDAWMADDSTEREVFLLNGQPYCDDCYYQQPTIVAALEAVGERGDYE